MREEIGRLARANIICGVKCQLQALVNGVPEGLGGDQKDCSVLSKVNWRTEAGPAR